MLRHPAEKFIKYLIVKDMAHMDEDVVDISATLPAHPYASNDAHIAKTIQDWGFLDPAPGYLSMLRNEIPTTPADFNPVDKLHRPSMTYLRDVGIYELFFPNTAVNEAWDIMGDYRNRQIVEQILMSRCNNKPILNKINQKHETSFTVDGLNAFQNFFWNVNLLTFDQWGVYLRERSSMFSDYMALLRAPPQMLLFKLRIEQQIESKEMVKRSQEISYNVLEQVNIVPGTGADKVKAVGVLTKAICECDKALSASDAALSGVLKKFEEFRMVHPEVQAPDIKSLAPGGNFSGSGKGQTKSDKVKQ